MDGSRDSPAFASADHHAALALAMEDADVTLWLPGDVPMYFRRIPPGVFLMGERGLQPEAEPVHRVVIETQYYLGTFPVTQAQYRAVMTAWPRQEIDPSPSHYQGDLRPVEQVSWDDANAWCKAVLAKWGELRCEDRRQQAVRAERFGLPSEAQWEHACRAGTETEYSAGDGQARLDEVAWHGEEWATGGTHEVGAKPPNAWGLHDMHGNVQEWCEDVWDRKAYRKREDGWVAVAWTLTDAGEDVRYFDPPHWGMWDWRDPDRVLRGGSSFAFAKACQSAYRTSAEPKSRETSRGFRVCLVRGPAARRRPAVDEAHSSQSPPDQCSSVS